MVVKFEEGYIITLGKAAVLQPGYAALLTRDGLEVVEPLTRRVLWTRKGIRPAPNSMATPPTWCWWSWTQTLPDQAGRDQGASGHGRDAGREQPRSGAGASGRPVVSR